jgi:acyl-CoA-binding protein
VGRAWLLRRLQISFLKNEKMSTSLESRFKKAVEMVQTSPADSSEAPSNNEKLRFYGLFKQATVGPCNTQKPSWIDVVARAKWDSWNSFKELSKEEAMEEYIDEVIRFLKRFPERPKVVELVKDLQHTSAESEGFILF